MVKLKPLSKQNDEYHYRHENKYVITEQQAVIIKSRLSSFLERDSHAGEKGMYHIQSVYFDDYDNSCFYDNEGGNDRREKFRIRIYDKEKENTKLELKRKIRGMTVKESAAIAPAQAEELLRGNSPQASADNPKLLNKLGMEMKTRLLRPKVIVGYDRIPFVYPLGNVRITLDFNIYGSPETKLLLNQNFRKRPALNTGYQILEVKFDEYLPDVIKEAVQMKDLQYTSFSKYYYCRKGNGLS